jgi:hypothetical protein
MVSVTDEIATVEGALAEQPDGKGCEHGRRLRQDLIRLLRQQLEELRRQEQGRLDRLSFYDNIKSGQVDASDLMASASSFF